MIDPQTTLAISMVQKKGTHALLLGSGVSRSAQIPTGWEVVLHLIRQIAVAENEECSEDPAAWYTERFNVQPDYGDLLGQLAGTQAGRGLIISSFIEPSEEERALGLKLPTPAHTAIARLVADGYIRVIVTTNFDRLLETALAEVGIVPTVIDSADAVLGSLPLVHNRCTIVKLHGDYVDSRIKNTTDELAEYDDPMVQLLRQVLRDYGLIICGWSGEWDTALVEEFNAAPKCPWFGSYWVSYGIRV